MKNLVYKFGNVVTFCALAVVVDVASRSCISFFHQPVLPESAKQLRKF